MTMSSSSRTNYLRVERVSAKFKDTAVLKELGLHVEQGELLTLLGASGCGKSTLLRCISGLLPLEQGEVYLENRNITHLSPKHREVGMVFQSYALFPTMTVYDNIAFGLSVKRKPRDGIRRRVEEMLAMVGLEEKAKSYPYELSGGQQQRVALARSLAVEPKLMLMDEPFSALDAQIRKQVRAEFRRLQHQLGMTTIFVTHDQEEALALSDRICVMDQGRIVQIGSPEDIYTHPETEFVARFIGQYNILTAEDLSVWEGNEGGLRLAGAGPEERYAVRPEAIAMTAAGEQEREIDKEAPVQDRHAGKEWKIDAKVEDLVVLGNVIRYTVLAGSTILMVDTLNGGRRGWMAPGSSVRLSLDPEDCRRLSS